MSREIIDIGTTANDGTGDPLRTAFEKVNNNSADQYQSHGWAQYGDSQYTVGAPLSCALGVATTVDLDGLSGTIKTQLPAGVTDFYDVSTSKITPVNSGDGYIFSLGFKAQTTNVSGYGTIAVDIGGAFGEIFRRNFTFPKGSGTEHDFYFSTAYYTLGTFLANGGIVKITSGVGTITAYDITLQIHKTHNAL